MFSPNSGLLAVPNPENIEKAKSSSLKISIDSLYNQENDANIYQCHPTTKTPNKYLLCDWFHQDNSKADEASLRKISIVPELAGVINTEVVEQMHQQSNKDLYFLNMMSPGTHLFYKRYIGQLQNETINKKIWNKQSKLLNEELCLDSFGRLRIMTSSFSRNVEHMPVIEVGGLDKAFGLSQPEKQDLSQQKKGDLSQQKKGDLSQAEKRDLSQPEKRDLSQPEKQDLSQQKKQDLSQQKKRDLSQPEKHELEDDWMIQDVPFVTINDPSCK